MKKEKNDIPSNFKNYLAYIKKRTIQNNKTVGKCNICNQDKKLKNNVCYSCYKKQYDKNIDYTKNLNPTKTITTNKKKLALIGLGALVPVIGVSTYLIIHHTKDNDKSSTLAQLKEKEKEKIRNIKPSEKILQGASLSPITTKNKYENIIDSAIKEIDNSKTKDALNAIVAKHTKLVTSARNIYANAIKFANKKHLANNKINKISFPVLDGAAHSAAKHALIDAAIQKALKAINEVTDIKTVEEVKVAQIAKINNAIKEYEESTGTTKALTDAKDAAKTEIDAIDVPDLDAAAHSATKHGLIGDAKTTAKQEINSATTIDEVASKLAAQKTLVQKAIDEYKASTGTIEALANAKKAAISEIDKIDVPDLDAAAHSATKHGLIAGAKTTAKQKINSATTIDEVASKLAAQKALVQKVIDEYKTSTGTNKVLAGKKTIAISEIDAIDVPDLDAAAHSATKHGLIGDAKTTAKQKINSATTIDEVASKLAAQKALVQKAIDEYKASTGTIEALANAKKAAISEIDKIDVPDLDAAAHSATKHGLIGGAKTTAKQKINSATTIDEVASKLAAQKALVQKVIDEYKTSTGTNKVLAGKKTIAISEIDAIDVPDLDAAAHSATKHGLIAGAKTTAKQKINSATTIDEVASKLVAQKALVQKAIDEYKASTGTIEALANAKKAAISEIDKIDVPDLDAAAHSATKHGLIAGAKTTAKQKINLATTIDEVASKLAAQKDLVSKVIADYNASTGTDKIKIDAVKITDFNLSEDVSKKLPSKVAKPDPGQTKSNVNFEFTSWQQMDLTGEIKWTALLKIGKETKNISGVIVSNVKNNDNPNDVIQFISINDENKNWNKPEENKDWNFSGGNLNVPDKDKNISNLYNFFTTEGNKNLFEILLYKGIELKKWNQKFKITIKEIDPQKVTKFGMNTIEEMKNLISNEMNFIRNKEILTSLNSETKDGASIHKFEFRDAQNIKYTIELFWVKKNGKWNIVAKIIGENGDTIGENDALLTIKIHPMSQKEI